MLAGNLVSILVGGLVHAGRSILWPQIYDWEATKQITVVEKEKTHLPPEEFKEEKLNKAKFWIIKCHSCNCDIVASVHSSSSLGYFTFWAVVAITWGTIGSGVIIALPLIESWETTNGVPWPVHKRPAHGKDGRNEFQIARNHVCHTGG
ncbi:hypothetical protein Scep_007310 [Stephania cephalantha]|uniref:Uncharacterized protein n=1 Tax=Stephania cephalantha TaxID=152367 RepID=A0AAP0PKZ2_9MAGN